MKVLLLFFVLLLKDADIDGIVLANGKLNITVYLSSMCKDSKKFITEQVNPVFNELKDYINVDFVPWGKAKIEHDKIVCQFGEKDCVGNLMQSCALSLLGDDRDRRMEYMFCEYATLSSTVPDYHCVHNNGIPVEYVNQCMTTNQGSDLQLDAARKTAPLQITFVPTIVYDGAPDEATSFSAFENFQHVTCIRLQQYYSNIC